MLAEPELASSQVQREQGRQKDSYDARRRLTHGVLESGDRVLVQQVGFKGLNKLANNWSDQDYGVPAVYMVQVEEVTGSVWTFRRIMLLTRAGVRFGR